MRVATQQGKGRMVIEERPTPKPGAGQIIVTEKAGARQAAAKRLGADLVLDPTEVDVQQEIMGLSGGEGMDGLFERMEVKHGTKTT